MRTGNGRARAILRTAASLATVEGLEGLSIGNLAAATGISKSGLYAHFGSKQELQLATIDEAERILNREVVQPALAAPAGLDQLAAACEAFFSYVQRRVFPGGCFFAATSLEMGTRPDPSRTGWPPSSPSSRPCCARSRPPPSSRTSFPPAKTLIWLAFELHAILLGADTKFVLQDDPAVLDLARRIVHQRLRLDNRSTGGC